MPGVRERDMIRRTITLVLALAAIGTGVLWAWVLLPHEESVAELARIRSLGIEIARHETCIVVTKRLPLPDPPSSRCSHERILNPDGTMTEIISFSMGAAASAQIADVIEELMPFRKPGLRGFDYCARPHRQTLKLAPWLPLVLFASFPSSALATGPLRRRRRRRKDLCVKCGYNLTGLPEPRCPECGAPCPDLEYQACEEPS
jgi:hypothetical protein